MKNYLYVPLEEGMPFFLYTRKELIKKIRMFYKVQYVKENLKKYRILKYRLI